jgi:hypothetical protein
VFKYNIKKKQNICFGQQNYLIKIVVLGEWCVLFHFNLKITLNFGLCKCTPIVVLRLRLLYYYYYDYYWPG